MADDVPSSLLRGNAPQPDRVLQISPDGSITIENLEAEEVDLLLQVYRRHMEIMVAMAGGRDQFRYRPEG